MSFEEHYTNTPPTYVSGFHDELLIDKMEYRKLGNTDMVVSRLGISTECFESLYKRDPAEIYMANEVIRLSLKGGVNFIDTSPYYGEGFSETLLGEILKEYPRSAYYIGTKVGRYSTVYEDMFDHSPTKTKDSIELSLERLDVKYIDLVTIQDIEYIRDLKETVKQILPILQGFKKQKKIRYIGISSFYTDKIREFIHLAGPGQINVVICNTRLTIFDHYCHHLFTFLTNSNIGVMAGQMYKDLSTSNKIDNESLSSHLTSKEIKQRVSSAVLKQRDTRIDYEKLVTHYIASHSDITVCLAEVITPFQLKPQYDAVLHPLKIHEKPAYKTLKEDVLKKRSNFEDIELHMYREWCENRYKVREISDPSPSVESETDTTSQFSKDYSKTTNNNDSATGEGAIKFDTVKRDSAKSTKSIKSTKSVKSTKSIFSNKTTKSFTQPNK